MLQNILTHAILTRAKRVTGSLVQRLTSSTTLWPFIACIFFAWIFIACNGKKAANESNTVVKTDTLSKNSGKTDTQQINTPPATSDSIIIARFQKDSTATTISGVLQKVPGKVVVYIDIKQGKTLVATLHTANPRANIRINQLFTPNGQADGPFGKQVTRQLSARGMYRLVIGHNLMAEGGSEVEFQVRIVVE